MLEWLAIWGVASATATVFKPILEKLATKVAEDIAKSYVKKCFSNVFSAFHKKPLAKATGLAVKKLLDLIEDELLDADLSRDQVAVWSDDVQKFLDRDEIATAIGSLFLDPDYHLNLRSRVLDQFGIGFHFRRRLGDRVRHRQGSGMFGDGDRKYKQSDCHARAKGSVPTFCKCHFWSAPTDGSNESFIVLEREQIVLPVA